MKIAGCITLSALIVLAATACRREPRSEDDRAGSAALTGASWIANVAAIDRIVAARCAREVSCGDVGPNHPPVDGEVCVREMKKNLDEAIGTGACPSGISGKDLDDCLDAIRGEGCANPLDVVSRLAACRSSQLCLKVPGPSR